MSANTGIEWTDATWNPIRGCSRVSEGCRHCYAEKVAYRFSGAGQPYEGLATNVNGHPSWTGKVEFVEKHLLDPLKWKRRLDGQSRRIFVNSMSDLFHENVPDEWIDRIFAVMALCPQHTFQVLTKRPERMLKYLAGAPWGNIEEAAKEIAVAFFKSSCADQKAEDALDVSRIPLPNVWLGVSVENQKTADERIPLLLQTPAAVRFLSAEPLLGPVNLVEMENTVCRFNPLPVGYEKAVSFYLDALRGCRSCVLENCDAREEEAGWIPKLDWVICGGESGSGARPMHPDWARSLRDQCQAAGVPFFFKQWGEWAKYIDRDVEDSDWRQPYDRLSKSKSFCFLNLAGGCGFHGERLHVMQRVGKKAAGAMLDGRQWREFPAHSSEAQR